MTRQLSTQDIQKLDNYFMHPWENVSTLGSQKRTVVARSEGVYVFDSDGNRLIDGPAGMWCVNVGHRRREIAEAIAAQALEMPYYSPWSVGNVPASLLAERLARLAPGDLNHAFFTTGGSTAVDSALRFMMFYNNCLGRPEKKHILSRVNAYHGSTYLSASCSGKGRDKNLLDFDTEKVHLLSDPNPYRRPAGMSVEAFRDGLVRELEDRILSLGPDRVGAFIAEPILASGGVIVPPEGYHRMCLEVCRKYDVLYISDEVVTAFGRLGHMFASQEVFGVDADMITLAKGITSGYVPLGAVLISDRLLDDIRRAGAEKAVFSNGFTYSGHPVACMAAMKNIDIIEGEGLLEHAREVGPYFQSRLRELAELPIVGDVRGMGLMGCVECVLGEGHQDELSVAYAVGDRIDRHCQRLGLIVRPLVNMCVMSPPLPITREQIDDMVGILRQGIERTMADLRQEGLWKG
jgi:putrescine---pyruvate transaminase